MSIKNNGSVYQSCILLPCWINLPVILVFVWSLYSFVYILSSAYSYSFTSSFQMWISLISFSCLMAVARTSSTMLHRSSESGHPCLSPNFNRETQPFTTEYYIGHVLCHKWASLVAQMVKNLPAMHDPWVGKIPWRRE